MGKIEKPIKEKLTESDSIGYWWMQSGLLLTFSSEHFFLGHIVFSKVSILNLMWIFSDFKSTKFLISF